MKAHNSRQEDYAMSDNPTRETPDSRSFEERVFARFDALDARMGRFETRMDRFESRLDSLEEKVDSRLRETRPIWEGVLARLTAIESELSTLNRQFNSLILDSFRLRVRVEKLEEDKDTQTA